MTKLVVFGGTGFTGGNIVRAAAARGIEVTSVSRSEPADRVEGVDYEIEAVETAAARLIPDADVVVAALSPRGDMTGRLVEVYGDLARQSAVAGARYVQIGGFSSLRPAAGEPRFVETDIPEDFRDEALEGDATRQMLVDTAPDDLDWLFVSPAAEYGTWASNEPKGAYRIGDEVAQVDGDGRSSIAGADFATAVIDEIETPAHSGHIGIAY